MEQRDHGVQLLRMLAFFQDPALLLVVAMLVVIGLREAMEYRPMGRGPSGGMARDAPSAHRVVRYRGLLGVQLLPVGLEVVEGLLAALNSELALLPVPHVAYSLQKAPNAVLLCQASQIGDDVRAGPWLAFGVLAASRIAAAPVAGDAPP